MKLRSVLKSLVTTFGGMVATPFLQAPATKLAEALHFDTTLSDRWGPLVQWLSDLAQNPWYIAFAAAIVGLAGGLRVDGWLRIRERGVAPGQGENNGVPLYIETRLRLRRDSNGSRSLLQEGERNIHAWQQLIVGIDFKDENADKVGVGFITDTLSITFSKPTCYERPIIDTFGHQLEGVTFYPLGTHGAVFQFYGGLPAGAIEIWFPPIGHYAKQSVEAAFSIGSPADRTPRLP